jgi:hypothetical protein
MTGEQESIPEERGDWTGWLSVHVWWTALLAGGILCVVALVLS